MKKVIGLFLAAVMWISTPLVAQDSTHTAPTQTKEKKESKPPIGIGLKAGVNFANVTNVSDVGGGKSTGFMIGAFFAPNSKGIVGFRTEFIFSKQGYDYAHGSTTGSVKLNYILLPQLFVVNISRFFELHAGFQMAFLLNATADSSKPASGSNPYSAIMDYYNRFDYGVVGGFEVKPFRRLFVGARYNLSLADLYKSDANMGTGPVPPFIPSTGSIDFKNNVVQVYAGVKF